MQLDRDTLVFMTRGISLCQLSHRVRKLTERRLRYESIGTEDSLKLQHWIASFNPMKAGKRPSSTLSGYFRKILSWAGTPDSTKTTIRKFLMDNPHLVEY